jgi:hypothetical protein
MSREVMNILGVSCNNAIKCQKLLAFTNVYGTVLNG